MQTPKQSPGVVDVLERWFSEAMRGKKPRTRAQQRCTLRLGGLQHLAGLRMDQVNGAVADAMLREVAHRGPAAHNYTRSQLKRIWRWAARAELYVGPNPWDGSGKASVRNRRLPLIGDAARRVDSACWDCLGGELETVSPVHAAFFLLLMRTAMRRSEGTHLRWDEVGETVITIENHKTSRLTGEKAIPLIPQAASLLADVRARGWSDRFAFPSPRSARGHIEDPWRAWKRLRESVGCAGVRIHDIRHGFAVSMYEAGADLLTIRDMLGHASIATTQRYIGRVSVDSVRTQAARAAGAIGLR
ncbi:MAG: site-specific integrase [Myxococcota bacterium]